MAIDTTPSTVATNALDALDFSSLIGGPMDAIIKAQALAAKTTYEFINEVGLTTDPDTGEKKPVNVTFQYNSGGKVATLTVPLLVILTVPNIEVSNFVIDFIANISASSSSTEETSSDSELGVDAEAEASLGIGPFSIRVKAKANYSSKQHSKAAKDSKYSVEYTMNVRVEGGQSDMPVGLQTVLSILQGSNTSVGPDDMVVARPRNLNMDGSKKTNLEIVVKDAQGYLAAGTTVELNLDPTTSPFKKIEVVSGYSMGDIYGAIKHLSTSEYSKKVKENGMVNPRYMINSRILNAFSRRFKGSMPALNLNAVNGGIAKISGVTDTSGSVVFQLELMDTIDKDLQGTITVISYVPISDGHGKDSTRTEVSKVPYTILIPSEKQGSLILTPDKTAINLTSKPSETVVITVTDITGTIVPSEDVTYEIFDSNGVVATSATFTKVTDTITSDASGNATITITKGGTPVSGNYNLQISNNSSNTLEISITV